MTSISAFSAVLFDLDGTLTDPKVGITKSVKYALNRLGIEVPDLERLNPFIGPPLAVSFKEHYGFTDDEAARAVALYREYFTDSGLFENELYPGIPELLSELKREGRRLLVATSKPAVYAERIVRHFGIDSYFEHVGGSELSGVRSDKTELIAYLMQQFGIDGAEAAMIGDRKHDIIGARNNGMAAIGVGYGYGTEEELLSAGAVCYVPTVEALHRALLP